MLEFFNFNSMSSRGSAFSDNLYLQNERLTFSLLIFNTKTQIFAMFHIYIVLYCQYLFRSQSCIFGENLVSCGKGYFLTKCVQSFIIMMYNITMPHFRTRSLDKM